jgi:molybdopterin/thiamine biosynthesis adenylyltransferase
MNDEQLLRYSRHLLLEEIDIEGQEKLLAAHVLVIGAGGLGSAAAPYLVAAGIGRVSLIDPDTVELSNLQRQVMHTQDQISKLKVASGKAFLNRLNSDTVIETYAAKATPSSLAQLLPEVDVVLDCTDQFSTRQQINKACFEHQVPLVSGSALGFDAQVSVFDFKNPHSPCYACIFPPDSNPSETNCASMGVFSPLVGIIGSLQAAQALQLLIGFGQPLVGRLLLWNALNTRIDEVQVSKNTSCPVCHT